MKNCATRFLAVTLSIMFGSDSLSATDSNSVLKYSTFLGPRSDYVFYTNSGGIRSTFQDETTMSLSA